jgi:hypothetical protein
MWQRLCRGTTCIPCSVSALHRHPLKWEEKLRHFSKRSSILFVLDTQIKLAHFSCRHSPQGPILYILLSLRWRMPFIWYACSWASGWGAYNQRQRRTHQEPESIGCFIEDQAFSPPYDLAPPQPPFSRQQVVSLTQSSCVSLVQLTDRRGCGGVRSQILRRRESQALYKSFNTVLSVKNH